MSKCTICHEDKVEKLMKAGDEMIIGFDLRDESDEYRCITIKDYTTVAGKRMLVDAVILANK
jgi:hypothetical protein